jgi:hypothetical protein
MAKLDAIIIVPNYFDESYFHMTNENDPWYQDLLDIIQDPSSPMGSDECEWFGTHCWDGDSITKITLEDQESLTEDMACIAWTVIEYGNWLLSHNKEYNIVHSIEYIAY